MWLQDASHVIAFKTQGTKTCTHSRSHSFIDCTNTMFLSFCEKPWPHPYTKHTF